MTTHSTMDTSRGDVMPYQMLSDKIDKVDEKLSEKLAKLDVSLGRLETAMVPRHEINTAVETRVPLTTYVADKAAIEMQIQELKAQPAATWVKIGIGSSIVFGCLGFIIAFGSMIIGIVSLIASHAIFH